MKYPDWYALEETAAQETVILSWSTGACGFSHFRPTHLPTGTSKRNQRNLFPHPAA
jgi:hypothetical protein